MVGQISNSDSLSRSVGAVTGEFVGDVYRHMFSDPWDFHPDNPHRQANVERALTYIEIAATLTAATFNLDVNEVKASAVIAARENSLADLAKMVQKNRDEELDAKARETTMGGWAKDFDDFIDGAIETVGGWIGLDGQTEVDDNSPHFMEIYEGGQDTYIRACIDRERHAQGRDLTRHEMETIAQGAAFKFKQIERHVAAEFQKEFYGEMFAFAAPYIEDYFNRQVNVAENTAVMTQILNPVEARSIRLVYETVSARIKALLGVKVLSKCAAESLNRQVAKKVLAKSALREAEKTTGETVGQSTAKAATKTPASTPNPRRPANTNKPLPSSSPVIDRSQFSGHMSPSGDISVSFSGPAPNLVPQNIRASEIQRMEYIMKQQLSEPGIVVKGIGEVKESPRLVAQYGGKIEDWVKMTSTHRIMEDGVKLQTHYYKNLRTGQKVDAKLSVPNELKKKVKNHGK